METTKLKKFAQYARRALLEQVSGKLRMVLAEDSAARRERPEAVNQLQKEIDKHGEERVVDRVAYIWFNRFCALRFMDVNRYNRIGVVSPAKGQFQPEILADAKMGHIDEDMVSEKIRQHIVALLDGTVPSRDPQGEAYRLLLVSACNHWNKAMPFLFQWIGDYTELLMPDDLLSGTSILSYTREAMTPGACEDVDVIGWLYQFYISEKKDEVFAGLKKNKKITPESIPAATQLFTPHYIVRYLVENSLGRLWMLNRPGSRLIEQMDSYVKPEEPETDFLQIESPEEIKICDPACGSGHMLTYTFDLLYAIYEEEGCEASEIPAKILTNNLYGIEIDERAGELAAFSLTMKARAKQRRFFNKGITPNICVLESVRFDEHELRDYMDFVGRDLFSAPLQTTLRQFEEADNFGSLIRPDVTDVDGMLKILASKNVLGQLFLSLTHQKVLHVLRQANYLGPKYHVVIANPPYMGNRSLNGRLQVYAKDSYPSSKSDLFAMFIERNIGLSLSGGSVSMITMQSWMFLSSYEALRARIVKKDPIKTMAHLGPRAFDSIGGEVVSTTAFVLEAEGYSALKGDYLRLVDGGSETEKSARILQAIQNPRCNYRFQVSSTDFTAIPGSPIAYWVSPKTFELFRQEASLGEVTVAKQGLATGDNDSFARLWHEVAAEKFYIGAQFCEETAKLSYKWYPYNKGGQFRKWFGNIVFAVNWENDGALIRNFRDEEGKLRSRPQNTQCYFQEGLTWSDVTSGYLSSRYLPSGNIYDISGHSAFPDGETARFCILAYLNTTFCQQLAKILNPTLHFQIGDYCNLPFPSRFITHSVEGNSKVCVGIGKTDWNSFETSWDFATLPLLNVIYRDPTLKAAYKRFRSQWQEMTNEMQRLEEENNRIFIEAYGLQDELTPEVPLKEITLTCNPHYRYGGDKSEEELEALLLADTMRELVSYAAGCMFGRYSLDKPGLILANQGETIEDYYKILSTTKHANDAKEEDASSSFRDFRSSVLFPADEDNVIPMLDGDWFTGDITERFREFLRVAFGEAHYEENIAFVESALNVKGKRNYGIRDYFLGEFYSDHVKRYKKRPIYWLFSSPKGSFNALIYMHRYRPETVSLVLNNYLREYRVKLTARLEHLKSVEASPDASKGEKTKALKDIEKLKKILDELDGWERDVLYPLAARRIEIDLDDGVKANYPKLGKALKKIPGLSA